MIGLLYAELMSRLRPEQKISREEIAEIYQEIVDRENGKVPVCK